MNCGICTGDRKILLCYVILSTYHMKKTYEILNCGVCVRDRNSVSLNVTLTSRMRTRHAKSHSLMQVRDTYGVDY